MGQKPLALAILGLLVSPGVPAQKPGAGTIISMSSVECGTKKENKKTSTPLLCQQYVVRTSTAEYQIRQPKPSKQDILPANMPIQFTLDNDLMKFKLNGKKYEFPCRWFVSAPAAVIVCHAIPGPDRNHHSTPLEDRGRQELRRSAG